jgi:hypothetical protein
MLFPRSLEQGCISFLVMPSAQSHKVVKVIELPIEHLIRTMLFRWSDMVNAINRGRNPEFHALGTQIILPFSDHLSRFDPLLTVNRPIIPFAM